MRLPLLVFHITAGVLAMFAGAAAMSFRKGSRSHGMAGNVFVASMLVMATFASYLAYMKHQTNNVFGGCSDDLYGGDSLGNGQTQGRRNRHFGLGWMSVCVHNRGSRRVPRIPKDDWAGTGGSRNVCLHAGFHEFGDSICWHRRPAHARARDFRQTTDRSSSLAHVLWLVYRYRFLLPRAATGISRLAARIARALGARPAATRAADFLARPSSLHQCVQENLDSAQRRCLLLADLAPSPFRLCWCGGVHCISRATVLNEKKPFAMSLPEASIFTPLPISSLPSSHLPSFSAALD